MTVVGARDEQPRTPEERWSVRSLSVTLLNLGIFGTAIAGTIGFFSSRLFWPADMFAPFRLQYAVLFLAAAVAAMVLRSPKTVVVSIVLFLWQAVSLVPLLAGSDGGEPVGDTIRLLHFNVLASNTNFDEVGDWAAQQEADIIVFQEATPEWGAEMEAALPDWVLLDTNTTQPGTYGIMMFAAPDVDVPDVAVSGVDFYPAIAATVRIDDQDLLIYSMHTLTPTFPSGVETANDQVDLAVRVAQAHDGPVVITGDLNATRWSPVYRRLTDQIELNDVADGAGLKGTWPDGLWFTGRIGIDHVLTSPGICSFDRQLGPALGSDHLPVIVDLAVSGCQ